MTMEPAPGVFLVASPTLGDPHVMRSVVYLLEHGPEGPFGVIVNRALDLPLRELWGEVPTQLAEVRIAAEGGPVNRHHGLLLHGLPDLIGAQDMGHGLALGGDLDQLAQRWSTGPDSHGPRLFLGHSGWGAGQLAAEMAQGTWIVRPGRSAAVIQAKPDPDLWEQLVAGPGLPRPSLN